MINWNSFQI